jgi:hypothetical protein
MNVDPSSSSAIRTCSGGGVWFFPPLMPQKAVVKRHPPVDADDACQIAETVTAKDDADLPISSVMSAHFKTSPSSVEDVSGYPFQCVVATRSTSEMTTTAVPIQPHAV